MDLVNVLVFPGVIFPLGKECLPQIARVSPRVKLLDASDLVTALHTGDLTADEQLDAMLAQAEVLFCFKPPKNVIARAPNLKWCQTTAVGIEHSIYADILQSQVILTNSRGLNAVQVSEFVLHLILMCAKQGQFCFQMKQKKQWQQVYPIKLCTKTVGIVGLGSIGSEVARLCKAFGMRVIATQRSAKRVTQAKNVDIVLPKGQLMELLAESDFVVLALPATPETNKLIGKEQLRAMKSTAYLINIARGSIVDEEALIHALEEKWIAGAALDTFTIEPLPTDSKLWELPNVIISWHIAGRHESDGAVATELFCENLRRYLYGKKLLNVIDKEKGY